MDAYWQYNGIRGRGPKPPPCVGWSKGLAVVMGSGRSIFDDINRFNPDHYKAEVIAVNHMILHYPGRVHHAVSLHPEEPFLWRAMRPIYGCDINYVHTHSHREVPTFPVDFVWDIDGGTTGTSGLFATFIALALGYEKVVLLGVPMDGNGHFWDPKDNGKYAHNPKIFTADSVRHAWLHTAPGYFQGRVRSMSGWTRELLGEPTPAWLKE